MTGQEAIKIHIEECNHRAGIINEFLRTKKDLDDETISECNENIAILKIAITALKEIRQYQVIGTVEECQEAVEKQRAKKPNLEGDGYADGHMVYDTWICPCCGISYEIDYDDYKYCPDCGQHIHWSE